MFTAIYPTLVLRYFSKDDNSYFLSLSFIKKHRYRMVQRLRLRLATHGGRGTEDFGMDRTRSDPWAELQTEENKSLYLVCVGGAVRPVLAKDWVGRIRFSATKL